MNYFEFANPMKLCSGTGALNHLTYELSIYGVKHPMVLSDRVLKEIGTLGIVLDALGEIKPARIDTDIPRDSSVEVVNRIAKEYKAYCCDGIIAVGGGSVLDTAKGVRLMISQQQEDLMELMGCESITLGTHVPFVAIPTTAGTGSEATAVAVIKDTKKHVKMEFITQSVMPDVALLDPRMTQTLPPRITASTGLDTLVHAIEAFSCLQKNPVSDAYAVSAIEIVRDNLVKVVENGNDTDARMAMANASFLAGAAFSNSMVGAVHAIGHALGGVCGVPHGDAMNLLLPGVMMYNLHICEKDYAKLLLHLTGPERYMEVPENERAKEAIREIMKLRKLMHEKTGLPLTLRQAGVDPAMFPDVARTAINDGAMIVNPRSVPYDAVMRILEFCYDMKAPGKKR